MTAGNRKSGRFLTIVCYASARELANFKTLALHKEPSLRRGVQMGRVPTAVNALSKAIRLPRGARSQFRPAAKDSLALTILGIPPVREYGLHPCETLVVCFF